MPKTEAAPCQLEAVTVRIDPALKRDVLVMAAAKGDYVQKILAGVVTRALRQYLTKHGARRD